MQKKELSLIAALCAAGILWSGASTAQAAENLKRFEIPAGSLADALRAAGQQGDAQILYTPELVEGRRVPALSGDYTSQQVLEALIRDAGLRVEVVDEGSYVIKPAATPAPQSAAPTPAAASSASRIEEVVVTARRREESQQDVPVAVTTLSGSFLENNAITQLSDLTSYVPALLVDNFNSPTTTNIGVRGVRSTDIAPGQDSAVGVYFAEVNYGYTVGISPLMFDLQSVETLKGPQGTLFGRNSTGGAMLLTPRKPGQEKEGNWKAGTTFFDGGVGYSASGAMNLPISDTFSVRAALNFLTRDGFVENVADREDTAFYQATPFVGLTNFDRLNDDRQLGWRVSTLWQPSDRFENYLMVQGAHVDGGGIGYALTALNPQGFTAMVFNGATLPSAQEAFDRIYARQQSDPWTAESNVDTFAKVDTIALSNASTWNFSDSARLKGIFGYRHYDRDDSINFDGLPLQVLEVRHPDTGRELSAEIQLQGESADGQFDWVSGIYFADQRIERRSSQVVLQGQPLNTHTDSDNKSYAAFAQATYRIAALEGLSVTGGVRVTRDERDLENRRFTDAGACALTSGGAALSGESCRINGEDAYTEPTYSVGLDYKLDSGTLVYLAHRRGYRAGGFDYGATEQDLIGPFQPEFVTDFELGVKKDWYFGDALLRTNLALYTQDYDDIQRFIVRLDQPGAAVTNAASAKIQGGELEMTFVPTSALSFSGFISLVDASFDQFITAQGDFSDNDFGQVPKTQYSLSMDYLLPLNPDLGDVRLHADWSHRSRVFYTDTTQGDGFGPLASQGQDAYGLLNLGVRWDSIRRSAFDLSLYVRNATNEDTRPFGVVLYQSLGYNVATIGDPRVVGVELSYRFGE